MRRLRIQPLYADSTAFGNRKKAAARTSAGHADQQDGDRNSFPVGPKKDLVVKDLVVKALGALGNTWDNTGRAGRVEVILRDMQ